MIKDAPAVTDRVLSLDNRTAEEIHAEFSRKIEYLEVNEGLLARLIRWCRKKLRSFRG